MLNYLVDGVIRYPNLIRAHIQNPLMEGNAESPFVRMLSTWLDQVHEGLASDGTPQQGKLIRIALQTAISSILVAALMPESSNTAIGFNLKDVTFRSEYIEYLTNSILSVAG